MQKTLFENDNLIQPTKPAFCIGAVSRSTLLFGDCLELMKSIPDGSIDAIITDPPYGTTACKWDSVIPFDLMWEQLNRIIKTNGAIVLFGSEPFSSALRMSNIKNYKYDWVWDKKTSTGGVFAKKRPMKAHENILVFNSSTYNPQMGVWEEDLIKRMSKKRYLGKPKTEMMHSEHLVCNKEDKLERGKYPQSVLRINGIARPSGEGGLHPTQKPVELMEYLIKTYTNENETVLDFTMGSGSTGVACVNTNRNFIGIEKDDKYFEIAVSRVSAYCG
jgi:DNA modification methylase